MQRRNDVLAYIALGSNLGDRAMHITGATEALGRLPECTLRRTSPWYESEAVGPGSQPDYINAVVELSSRLPPEELLTLLHRIEAAHGRIRGERWTARPLDLDLLLYGDLFIHTERLQLPHPRLEGRNFVVYPLFDLAPELVLPHGTTLAALRDRLESTGLRRHDPVREASRAQA